MASCSFDEVNKHSSLRISRFSVAHEKVQAKAKATGAGKEDESGSVDSSKVKGEVVEEVSLDLEGRILHGKTCLCQPVMENRSAKKKESFMSQHWHFRVDQLVSEKTESFNSKRGSSVGDSSSIGGIAFGFCTRKVNVAKGLALVDHKKVSTTTRASKIPSKSSSPPPTSTAPFSPEEKYLKEGAVSSQTIGGDGKPATWCVYSSPATGALSVCGESSARRYCKAFKVGDIVTLKIERKKVEAVKGGPVKEENAKEAATDCSVNVNSRTKQKDSVSLKEEDELVQTRVSVLVNFVNQGVAFEFTGNSDLFAAVSLYGNGQRIRLLSDKTHTQGAKMEKDEKDEKSSGLKEATGKGNVFSSASCACEMELSLISANIEETKDLLKDQFKIARENLDKQEAEAMAVLDRNISKYTLPLQNQARLLQSLQRTATSTTAGSSLPTSCGACPLAPVCHYDSDVRGKMAELKLRRPVVTDRETFDDLLSQSQKLFKVEKELAKVTKKLASTKEDLDKKKKILKRSNPLVPTDLVHHVYASGWDCCDGGQKAFWDKFLQVSAMEKLSIFTHPELLSLWVEQKSPSCAASAVAGACNVLSRKWRQLREAGDSENIDPGLGQNQNQNQNRSSSTVAEGAKPSSEASSCPCQPANTNTTSPSSSEGLQLKGSDILEMYVGRWETAVRKVRRGMKELLTIEDEEKGEDVIHLIEEALEAKYGVEFHPKLSDLNTFLSSCVSQAIEDWEASEEIKSKALYAFSQNKKDFEAKVRTWWTKRGGLTKLTADKPSTAPIGNETILKIFDKVRDDFGIPLRTWKFMSSKKSQCQISENDSEERIDQQWNSLKTSVANTSQVLLFHLQNHYSLVYAARETHADEGYGGKHLVRQVLVAKPGQQPCRWIDFVSVRETILSWVGHAVIGIELENEVDVLV